MQRDGDGKRNKDVRDMQKLATGKDERSDASAAAGGVSAASALAIPAATVVVPEARSGIGQGGAGAQAMAGGLTVEVPIKAVSTLNVREHWSARARRAKAHRTQTFMELRCAAIGNAVPCTVTLTRIAPRELDGDNLQASLKACRDGVADWLKVDDRDPRVAWEYQQRKGAARQYAVEVRVS